MPRRSLASAALAVAALITILGSNARPASAQASILPCTGTSTLLDEDILALDDGSLLVSLAPVFTAARPFRIAGRSYTSMFVNVNGNVTFESAFGTYTPSAVPGLSQPTLAPFFADVDLRNRGAEVNPGNIYYCIEPANDRVMVTWEDSVHYNATAGTTSFTRQNTFQMIITAATVCGTAGAIVEFRYQELIWHAGTASGAGTDGLCTAATTGVSCFPAVAGVDYGDTVTAVQLPGSLTTAVTSTLPTTSNVGTPGVWRIEINPTSIPSCGNGVDDGACEDCDAGGESATCDADCTFVVCGDGTRNALAGEVCDTGGDTATCDDDCTLPMCGDGNPNAAAGEQCDTGGPSATCDADCTLAVCGDGTLNGAAGEICDAGGETALCDGDCTPVMCGDGRRNPAAGEECDDGNNVGGDGCSTSCRLEACGNGVVDSGEECDGGAAGSASCDVDCTFAMCGDGTTNALAGEACDTAGESATCDDDCSAVSCGDGNLNEAIGELCDDGNLTVGDGCNATCQTEVCGNSVLDAGELCDEGVETATCDSDCTAPECGDGRQNVSFGESCDDGNTEPGDGCNELCVSEACGNSIVDRGEECDDGAASAACDADCTNAICGAGLLNTLAAETCDEAGEAADCDDDCTAPACGDGNTNEAAGEGCDDGNTTSGDGCSASCEVEAAPDSGMSGEDAGTGPDAGVRIDSGVPDFGVAGGACGCRVGGDRAPIAPLMLALAALALVIARRRR